MKAHRLPVNAPLLPEHWVTLFLRTAIQPKSCMRWKFFLFPRPVIWHPKRLAAEGWTLNSAGRTEGRSTHPTSANERDRAEAETAVRKKQPRGCGSGGEAGCLRVSKITGRPLLNAPEATSFTFHRRMGDFPRRFVRRRWWRISAAVPFTATTRLPTTLESETTESTAYSLLYRCDSPCEVMVSAWLRCSSSVSAPFFTSWTEDPLKSCWTSDSISVRTFSFFPLLAEARHHQRDSCE